MYQIKKFTTLKYQNHFIGMCLVRFRQSVTQIEEGGDTCPPLLSCTSAKIRISQLFSIPTKKKC